jgi:hypothetical protein
MDKCIRYLLRYLPLSPFVHVHPFATRTCERQTDRESARESAREKVY